MPKFSIIIPCYNNEKYIAQAISSVLSQTYSNYELIIVDDHSTDDTLGIAKQIIKLNPGIDIKLIAKPKNSGVAASRNLAMDRATGEYILFMDGDDEYMSSDVFAAINRRLRQKQPDVLLFGFVIEYVDKNGRTYRKLPMQASRVAASKTYQLSLASFRYVWSMCFRRELAIENQVRFNEEMDFYEDVVFRSWLICYADRIAVLRKKCYRYFRRPHSGGSLSSGRSYRDGIGASRAIYRSIKDLIDGSHIPSEYRRQIRVAMLLQTSLGVLNITGQTIGRKISTKS